MVNPELVTKKTDTLDKYVEELIKYRQLKFEEFNADNTKRWASERVLHLAIETIIDIGNHIISDERLGSPDKLEDIIKILGRNKVISENLTKKLEGAAGFRNILVHEYAKINTKKVYENLQKAPEQFKMFIKEILAYVS